MNEFLLSVAAGLAATVIFVGIIHVKTRAVLSWSTFKLFWSITRRLKDAGVSNIFPSRVDYSRFRREQSVSDYMSTAHRELIYIGFWLAEGVEIDTAVKAIRNLVTRGSTVELVFLTQNPATILEEKLAAHLAISLEALRDRLRNAWSEMMALRNGLPADIRPRFILRWHDEIITASTFIFDPGTAHAKTLMDLKLYGAGRRGSFGLELRPTSSSDSLYARATQSFMEIRKRGTVVP